ncbi:hypothetical protein XELAEV_18029627mg [Xenopus laevis]|uniref:Uncharacterized protein n=1 Tax=Xenopus laevis TaxID=8355 RepID=A0A974CRQ3_XENLA|nr:hypothetical protein XELAEV_18029627mg [Xenopus laevis]
MVVLICYRLVHFSNSKSSPIAMFIFVLTFVPHAEPLRAISFPAPGILYCFPLQPNCSDCTCLSIDYCHLFSCSVNNDI